MFEKSFHPEHPLRHSARSEEARNVIHNENFERTWDGTGQEQRADGEKTEDNLR